MTDYRALCAELVELSAPTDSIPQLAERLTKLSELASRARAALAQPEPVAPTDEELLTLTENVSTEHLYAHESLPSDWDFGDYCSSPKGLIDFARAVLARWGTPANTTSQEDYDRD